MWVKMNVKIKMVRLGTLGIRDEKACSWARDSQGDQIRGRTGLWEKQQSWSWQAPSGSHKAPPAP